MDLETLELEKPIAELEDKIAELRQLNKDPNLDIVKEIKGLETQRDKLLESIFSDLSRAQVMQLARHAKRPHAIDYIQQLFTEFDELHGVGSTT